MIFQNKSYLLAVAMCFCAALVSAQESAKSVISVEQVREAIKTQLPPPQEGFVWQLYKNVAFPKPAQWNEHEKSGSLVGIPITVYAASPEEFSETKQFEMGMTIQIMTGPQRIRGIEAKKMALAYLKPIFDAHKKEEILMFEQSAKGDFERTFLRYRDAPPGLKPIIVQKFFLANNVTDSVYIFTFESPAESWVENWTKYGTPIFSKLNVIPNMSPN